MAMLVSSVALLSASVLTTLPDMTVYINQSAKTYTARGAIGWTGADISVDLENADGTPAPAWASAGMVHLSDASTLWETGYEGEDQYCAQTLFMDNDVTVVAGLHTIAIYNTSVTELHSPPGPNANLLSSIPTVLIIRNVAAYGSTLYVATNDTFLVFSLDDPTSPELQGNGKAPGFECKSTDDLFPMPHFSVTKNPDGGGVYGTVVCNAAITAIDFTNPNQIAVLDMVTPPGARTVYCSVRFGETLRMVVRSLTGSLYLYSYSLNSTSQVKLPDNLDVYRLECIGAVWWSEEVIVMRQYQQERYTFYFFNLGGNLQYQDTLPYDGRYAAPSFFVDDGVLYGFNSEASELLLLASVPKENIPLYSGVLQRGSGVTEKIPWTSGGDILSCKCKNGVLSVLTTTKASIFGVGLWLEMGVDGATTTNEDVSLVVKGKYAGGSAPDVHRTLHYDGYQPPLVTHVIGTVYPVAKDRFDFGLLQRDYFETLYPDETLVFEITGKEGAPLPSWLNYSRLNETNPYGVNATEGSPVGVCAGHDGESLAILSQTEMSGSFSVSFYDMKRKYVFTPNASIPSNLPQNVTVQPMQPFSSWRGDSGTVYASVIENSGVSSYYWGNATFSKEDDLFTTLKFISGPFVIDGKNHAFVLGEQKVYVAGVIGDSIQIKAIYSTDSATLYILTSTSLMKYRWGGAAFTLEKDTPIASAGGYSCFVIDATLQVAAMCKGPSLVVMGLEDAQVRGVWEGVEGEVLEDIALLKAGVSVVTHKKGAKVVSWGAGVELAGIAQGGTEVSLVAKVTSSLGTASNQTFVLNV